MNWRDHIVADPQVLAGKPVIRGTRIAVDFLLGLFAEGWTLQQVLENYPGLTEESVRATFACASETLGDEAVYPRSRRTGQMHLLADENFPAASVRVLRERGHDVVSVAEEMPGTSDLAVLRRAHSERRILVTFDRDFGTLVFHAGEPAPGIVYLRLIPRTPVEPAALVHELASREDLGIEDHLTVLDRDRIRQRRLPPENEV